MKFLKTHRKSLIIGFSSFVIGFACGQVWQVRSFNQRMVNNIFNQVAAGQSQMGSVKRAEERRRKIDEEYALDEKKPSKGVNENFGFGMKG